MAVVQVDHIHAGEATKGTKLGKAFFIEKFLSANDITALGANYLEMKRLPGDVRNKIRIAFFQLGTNVLDNANNNSQVEVHQEKVKDFKLRITFNPSSNESILYFGATLNQNQTFTNNDIIFAQLVYVEHNNKLAISNNTPIIVTE